LKPAALFHQRLLSRQKTACRTRDSANLAQLLLPEPGVEFREDGLDLPGVLLAALVGGLEDVDALDGCEALAERGRPAKSDGVAGDGVDGEDIEADGWLGALAGDEGGFAGEGSAAEWYWRGQKVMLSSEKGCTYSRRSS
jgi:hypothetical protein